jgi:hypothetical protein
MNPNKVAMAGPNNLCISYTDTRKSHWINYDQNVKPITKSQIIANAREEVSKYGWGEKQHKCLITLWNRESGWNHKAKNKSSGAYGIPQALPASKMKSAGADWKTNPMTQVKWGLKYIKTRYQSPCGALSHSNKKGWY